MGKPVRIRLGDTVFNALAMIAALFVIACMAGILLELVLQSRPALQQFGVGFLWSTAWNPVTGQFGALSSIYGTLVSTLLAMALAVPMSLLIALFLVELAPAWVSRYVGGALELLAAIPSIIYGMWGLFFFAPFMADHIQPLLKALPGNLPLFSGPPMGIGMLTTGIILALMVLPFTTAVMRDVLGMVPVVVKEAAYGMGSTTWETIWHVTVPYARRGLMGAVFLGLARAIGETMAVTFVIGNDHQLSASLFAPGNSIASTLANEFTEASDPLYLSSLVELGLVLFAMTLLIQILAQSWIKRIGQPKAPVA